MLPDSPECRLRQQPFQRHGNKLLCLCLACGGHLHNFVEAWELGVPTSSNPVLHLILSSICCGSGYGRAWAVILGALYLGGRHFRDICVCGWFTVPSCEVLSATAAFVVRPSSSICRAIFIVRCLLDPIFPDESARVNVDWTGHVCGVCHTALQRCSCPRNGPGRGVARSGGQL